MYNIHHFKAYKRKLYFPLQGSTNFVELSLFAFYKLSELNALLNLEIDRSFNSL